VEGGLSGFGCRGLFRLMFCSRSVLARLVCMSFALVYFILFLFSWGVFFFFFFFFFFFLSLGGVVLPFVWSFLFPRLCVVTLVFTFLRSTLDLFPPRCYGVALGFLVYIHASYHRGGFPQDVPRLFRMAAFNIEACVFHINREFVSGRFSLACSDGFLAYSIRDYHLGRVVHDALPPPLDRCPEFPEVYFNRLGEPYLWGAPDVVNNTVFQIVPDGANPYVVRFGTGDYREWDPPEVTFEFVKAWLDLGKDVVVHPYRAGIGAAGESRGFSRFVVGGGLSLFVVREVGKVPEGARLGGECVGGMVVVYGVEFSGPVVRKACYHLIPADYLVDPDLPGLPSGLSREELLYRLAPPPVFGRGEVVWGSSDLFHSRVHVEVSLEEWDEGANTFPGVTLRGDSYRALQGL
jgi:hypothetical protein